MSKELKRKIQSRLLQIDKNLCEMQDSIGQISHLVEGLDVEEFCKSDDAPTPLDKNGVCE